MVCAPQIRRAGRLWNRRPNRIARHLAVRHLAVRHLAIPHLTVPHPTARHLVVYSLTVSKQGKARRMRRPRPWSPYLHRRSTAYGRARCAGCWRTGSPVLAPAPWPPVSEPSSMRLRSKAARKGWTIFPTMPRRWPHWAWTPRPARNAASRLSRHGLMPSIRANAPIRMP